MAKTLLERFNAALGANARASDVSALIDDLGGELLTAEGERNTQHAIAVNARSDDATADAAADAEAKAERRISRLSGQLDQMRERLADIKNADRRREFQTYSAEVRSERDQLASDLKADWPLLEAKLLSFLWRLTASDLKCRGLNEISAEAVARNCPGNFTASGITIPRLTATRIPSFGELIAHPLWPPQRNEIDRCAADPAVAARKAEDAASRVSLLERQMLDHPEGSNR
jgi:hypothetical protein